MGRINNRAAGAVAHYLESELGAWVSDEIADRLGSIPPSAFGLQRYDSVEQVDAVARLLRDLSPGEHN